MAFVRNGDVFVRDLRSGALTQLTRSNVDEARPQWGRDGGLVWRVGNDWYRWDRQRRVARRPSSRPKRIPPPRRKPTTCATASCA